MAFFINTNIFVAALRGRAPQVQEHIMRLPPEDVQRITRIDTQVNQPKPLLKDGLRKYC